MVIEAVDKYQYHDAMFEAVRLALAERGDEYDAAYIQGITGMAFRMAGPCPCAPTCSSGVSTDGLVELLGYELELLYLGENEDSFQRPVSDVIAGVKEETRAGRPVPVWHAFTYAEWDLVCGFDEEKGEFLGVCTYGGEPGDYMSAPEARMKEAANICPAYGAMIIGEKVRDFDAREAELSALEEAVRHCNAPRDPFLDCDLDGKWPWRFREGAACYEAWARKFSADPDRVPDRLSDRYPFGVYSSTRQAGPVFLRQMADKYPEAAAQLTEAASHFERDATTLQTIHKELLGWEASWDEPDPTKAKRTAELLSRAREAYVAGTTAIEEALEVLDPERVARAHQRAVVKRSDGSAMVQNVRPLEWHKGHDCTFFGALAEALGHTDSLYTYSDLMGLSGQAFLIRWANEDTKTKWCGSCAIGEMPDEWGLIQQQTGWDLPGDWVDANVRDNDAFARRIAEEIDAGRTVLSYPEIWNMALIYGYEDGGKTLIVNDYMDKRKPSRDHMAVHKAARIPIEKLGPLQLFLGERSTPPEPRKAVRAALERAVLNWRREKHHGGIAEREYWYGEAALEAWIDDLRGFDGAADETKRGLAGLDPWVYTQFHDARQTAAQFLKDWSVVAVGDAREALSNAAGLYEKEAEALAELVDAKHAALAAESFGPDEWSAEDRKREIHLLTASLDSERKAIAELERTLAAM